MNGDGRRWSAYEVYNVLDGSHLELNKIEKLSSYGTKDGGIQSSNVYKIGTTEVGKNVSQQYVGSILENVKYSSVDNWTKHFTPNEIKFRIS